MAKKKSGKGKVKGTDKDIKKQLAELEDVYDSAEEKEFAAVKKGKYPGKVESAVIENAASSGRLQVCVEITIASGKEKGRKIWWRPGIDNEDAIGYFKGHMARLGIEIPKKMRDLPDTLAEELVGSIAMWDVKPQKDSDFTNVKPLKALDSDDIDEDDDDEDDDDDKKKKKKGKKDEDEDEEEDEDEDEDEDDDDDDDEDEEDDEDEDEDDDEDDDEKPKKGKKGKKKKDEDEDEDDDDGEGVTLKFKDDDLDKKAKRDIRKLSQKHDFDAKDYTTKTDLLADIAEHVGVSGEFDDASELIAKVKKAKSKAKDAEDDEDDEDEDDDD